ncbi:cytochrome d ubiquinol oxidase subunit II [Paenibacillus yanchengensis]|uniref:Cytochrome d ubiquinol oxidase subunit II n=1 Tax=Paenibacillus yanchengensis TaxID=2035833 RepID=A0ABW4YI37_9BACL
MSLNELWFILIAVLFVGFFFLEGFDFGVGMSSPFLGKTDHDRRILINTIGPFWDANEVWLITAAGAMFAAFPHWYSTMFSGYYILLTFILLALICRGVAFEFRGKLENQKWRKTWDTAIFIGSFFPPLFFGMLFASMIRGMPIDATMNMSAGFADIVNLYSITGGVAVVALCLLHGLTFISLRTEGALREKARKTALFVWPIAIVLLGLLAVQTIVETNLFEKRAIVMYSAVAIAAVVAVLAYQFIRKQREGLAFGMSGLLIAVTFIALFAGLFPTLMVSSLDSAFDLTVYNAASGSYTLKAMTIVTAIILPFVLAYQTWSYFVFHKRVTSKKDLEY